MGDSKITKYIAMSGVASRRAAETMIQEGRVKVNGKKITEQGVKSKSVQTMYPLTISR